MKMSRNTTHGLAKILNKGSDGSIKYLTIGGIIIFWSDRSRNALKTTVETEEILGFDNTTQPTRKALDPMPWVMSDGCRWPREEPNDGNFEHALGEFAPRSEFEQAPEMYLTESVVK